MVSGVQRLQYNGSFERQRLVAQSVHVIVALKFMCVQHEWIQLNTMAMVGQHEAHHVSANRQVCSGEAVVHGLLISRL
jgi:hypothetical protein